VEVPNTMNPVSWLCKGVESLTKARLRVMNGTSEEVELAELADVG